MQVPPEISYRNVDKTEAVEKLINAKVAKKDIMAELDWEDRHRVYLALRGVLHALRDRLTVQEAVGLGAQLPMLVRGFYYEEWRR